jgi:hypothetical protein
MKLAIITAAIAASLATVSPAFATCNVVTGQDPVTGQLFFGDQGTNPGICPGTPPVVTPPVVTPPVVTPPVVTPPVVTPPVVNNNNTSTVNNNANTSSNSSSNAVGNGGNGGNGGQGGKGGQGQASALGGTSSASGGSTSFSQQNNYQRSYRSPGGFLQVPNYSGIWNLGITGIVDNDGYGITVGITTAIGAPSYAEARELDIRQAEAGRTVSNVSNIQTVNPTTHSTPALPVPKMQQNTPIPEVETECKPTGKGWKEPAHCSGLG